MCECIIFMVKLEHYIYRCSLFMLDKAQQELVAVVFDSDVPSEEVS